MFKSTEVLPVMIMDALIPGLRRRYIIHEDNDNTVGCWIYPIHADIKFHC